MGGQMRLILAFAAILAVAGCNRLQSGSTGPPDLSGRWQGVDSLAEPWPDPLPLTPAARASLAAFDPDRQDPAGFCMPYGTPRNTLATGAPMEVLQKPDRVYFIFQPNLLNAETRRVYLDGRPVPAAKDIVPTWLGISRGHWDHEVLAVETIGIEPQALISETGLSHGTEFRLSERWSLATGADGRRQLIDELTLEDPKTFTAPIHTRRVFVPAPDTPLLEPHCSEQLWIDNLWRYRLAEHAAAARAAAGTKHRHPKPSATVRGSP